MNETICKKFILIVILLFQFQCSFAQNQFDRESVISEKINQKNLVTNFLDYKNFKSNFSLTKSLKIESSNPNQLPSSTLANWLGFGIYCSAVVTALVKPSYFGQVDRNSFRSDYDRSRYFEHYFQSDQSRL